MKFWNTRLSVGATLLLLALPASAQVKKTTPVMPAAVHYAKAGETWGQILLDRSSLETALATKKLDSVHDIAFSLRDAVVTLPYKSDGLSRSKKATLEEQVRIIATLVDTMHDSADQDDLPKTRATLKKVKAHLDMIAALYPANALPTAQRSSMTLAERQLFLTPGGAYIDADIQANGNTSPTLKFAGYMPSHDTKVKSGEVVCPISETRPDPSLKWIIGGKTYTFCCPPCISEFVQKAKKALQSIKAPEEYVKP